jgi:hypothetical protein
MSFTRIFERSRRPPSLARTCVFALAIASAGCDTRRDAPAVHTAPGDSTTVTPATPVEPPVPDAPQVGRSDSLLNRARPALQEWVALWRDALPGFAVDSLWSDGTARWVPKFDRRQDPGFGRSWADRLLGLRSPDGRHVLDIDSYLDIVPSHDTLDVGGEPDTQSTLEDRRTHALAVVAFCGTPCTFDWGAWLAPGVFALGGWSEVDGFETWYRGDLAIYSLRDSTVTTYVTRAVRPGAVNLHARAWTQWLLKRYRALASARA